MQQNEGAGIWHGGLRFFAFFLRALSHPIFRPEADERRFLAGLPIAMFVIIFTGRSGWLQPLGPNAVLAIFALWIMAFLLKFGKRLKNRGELKRAIIAPAAFVALLLGLSLY